jgi:hypothetical protein
MTDTAREILKSETSDYIFVTEAWVAGVYYPPGATVALTHHQAQYHLHQGYLEPAPSKASPKKAKD